MIHSEWLGMSFWLDENKEFCYCPTFTDGTPDKENGDYVSNWDDFGSYPNELFHIHKKLIVEDVEKYYEVVHGVAQ